MKTDATTKTPNQWYSPRKWAMAAALLFLLAVAGSARAQSVTNVIYSDSFARVGQLVGTTPDTVDATGAAWIGGVPTNGIVTDGTEAAVTNKLQNLPWADAYLPLIPETGHVYSVSCSVYGNANDNQQWLAMGFAVAPGQANAFNNGNVGVAWLLTRCSNNGCQFFGGGGTANGGSPGTLTYGALSSPGVFTITNFTIVLNTATNPARWSVSWYTNGVFASVYNYATFPTAENGTRPGYVGLGETSNARGNFQNFTVTDVVPTSQAPTILEQPNNLTAPAGHTATFWISASGLPDPTYQWVTNNGIGGPTNAIVGATNATYTTPELNAAYNSLQYQAIASTVAGSVTSSVATLTVTAGTPTVFSATKSAANLTNVIVMFSGPVDSSTSQNHANYALQINGAPSGVSIIGASAGSVPGSVVLQTSTLNTNAGYYLAVQNVQDQVGDTINTSTNPVLPAGLMVYLRGDSGVQLDANNKVVQWLDQTTNGNNAQQFFGMSVNVASESIPGPLTRPTVGSIGVNSTPAVTFSAGNTNYMTVPPAPSLAVNGNQTLYVFANPSSFGAARALINENVGNLPAPFDFETTSGGGTIVCQVGDGSGNLNEASGGANLSGTEHTWVRTSQNIGTNALAPSATPITNTASFYIDGQPYGVMFGNYNINAPGPVYSYKPLYIGWRQDGPHIASPIMDGQMGEILVFNTPLSGADLTNVDNYFGQKYYSFSFTANLSAATTSSNGFALTYTIGASQGPLHFSYQWQLNGTNIPGATSQSYNTGNLGPANSNTTYDVTLTLPNGTTFTSATNTLTVLPVPPLVASAGIPLWEATGSTNIIVLFDEATIDPVTATVAGNYALNNGASVLSAVMGIEPNKVVLTTTPLAGWNANPGNYSLTVQNVKDLYGNTIVTAASPVGIYPATTALWLEASNGVVIDNNGSYTGVQQWNDQSGNGDNMFQINGAPYEPLFTSDSHGIPTVKFTGTNVYVSPTHQGFSTFMTSQNGGGLDYPPLRITGDMSIFAVVNYASVVGNTNGEIVSKTGSPNANQPAPYDYYVTGTPDAILLRGNGTNNGSFTAVATNVLSLGVPHIVAVTEAGSTVSHYLDTAPAGTGVLSSGWSESSDADQGQALQLGERGDYVNRLNGNLSELILISQAVDSNDLVAIQNYLISKYYIPTGTNAAAAITQQPFTSTNINQDATLIVPAAGAGVPQVAYQWFDTNNIAQAGQTNATLTISNIQTSDSYYLVVTNLYNAVTSSVVSVTVVSGLNVALGPSVSIYAGLPYTFTAQASGTVPFYYQWYQGASPIANATNASYSTVAVLGVTNSYSCTVTNPFNGYSSTNAGPVTLTGVALPTNAFSQTLLADGPIAYWRLNESSGSPIAYDYVGGYNGVYGANTTNGLPGPTLLGASDVMSVAMGNTANNVTNGSVFIPEGVNLNTNVLTFLCWIYQYKTESNPAGLIFSRYTGNIAGCQMNGPNLAYTWDSSLSYNYPASWTLPVGSWELIAVTVTTNNAFFYTIDSTIGFQSGAVSQNIANPVQSLAGGVFIGTDPQATARIFVGQMDEVAIFNYALSANQLQQLYTAATTSPVSTNATKITFAVTNNLLYLSWPADHTGWTLQAQTNKVSVGISTNWVNYNGGQTGVHQVAIPINLTNGTVFYRLLYP